MQAWNNAWQRTMASSVAEDRRQSGRTKGQHLPTKSNQLLPLARPSSTRPMSYKAYIHTCTLYAYVYACTHTYYTYISHADMYAFLHTYIHACIHTYIHTYIHTLYIILSNREVHVIFPFLI